MLTDEYMIERLREVNGYSIGLQEDPSLSSTSEINKRISMVQSYKDRVAFLLAEAIHNHTMAEINKSRSEHELDSKTEELLATDADVQAQKSAEMRSAKAKIKIPELVKRQHNSDVDLIKSVGYLKALQTIFNNLDSTNNNIIKQLAVLQMGLSLGEARGKTAAGVFKMSEQA